MLSLTYSSTKDNRIARMARLRLNGCQARLFDDHSASIFYMTDALAGFQYSSPFSSNCSSRASDPFSFWKSSSSWVIGKSQRTGAILYTQHSANGFKIGPSLQGVLVILWPLKYR